jgi:hypothetical protein
MVSEDKGTSSKKLYSFIKSKKCDGSGVASLKKDGKTYADDQYYMSRFPVIWYCAPF